MISRLLLFTVVLLITAQCDEGLRFPIEPYIEFRSLDFVDMPGPSTPDSLKLKIYFRDGDFDLGLKGAEIDPPYNESDFFLKSGQTTDYIDKSRLDDYVSYNLKRTMDQDTLPDFVPPYDCKNWYVLRNDYNVPIDTFYRELNENYFNFFFDLYVKNNDGTTEKYEWNQYQYPKCDVYGLNGRMPIPFESAPPVSYYSRISSKEGILTYDVTVYNFSTRFDGMKILFRVRIKDRALHESNEIETNELQF